MNQRVFHKWSTIAWAVSIVPTMIWWRDSIPWLTFISVYALVVSHWGAWQASLSAEKATKAEEEAKIAAEK